MDDLVLVYDKLNVAAGKFASGLYNHSKKMDRHERAGTQAE